MASRKLYTEEPYCSLSTNAKILYGYLLEEQKKAKPGECVFCSQKDAASILNCAEGTARRAFKSLEEVKLIDRRSAKGMRTRIFVKDIEEESDEQKGFRKDAAEIESEEQPATSELLAVLKESMELIQKMFGMIELKVDSKDKKDKKDLQVKEKEPKEKEEALEEEECEEVDGYSVIAQEVIFSKKGHCLPLADYLRLKRAHGEEAVKHQIKKIVNGYPANFMNMKLISKWCLDYNRRHEEYLRKQKEAASKKRQPKETSKTASSKGNSKVKHSKTNSQVKSPKDDSKVVEFRETSQETSSESALKETRTKELSQAEVEKLLETEEYSDPNDSKNKFNNFGQRQYSEEQMRGIETQLLSC